MLFARKAILQPCQMIVICFHLDHNDQPVPCDLLNLFIYCKEMWFCKCFLLSQEIRKLEGFTSYHMGSQHIITFKTLTEFLIRNS